jgi:16S rRNA (cytidine1402-2'-O)-methyltransferase
MTSPKSKAAKPSGGDEQRPSPGAAHQKLEPGLYVVATPIGNLRDITLRALDVLRRVDLVLAEDTRVTRKLLSAHGISARVEAYHEHNAESAGARALEALAGGAALALVSDAGTPLVSDPGERLVREVIEAGHRVIPIPGASALLAAVSAAGLPGGRFMFAGFPPPKSKARRDDFAALVAVPSSLVFFESGPRLAESLADMAAVFGARQAVIGRELTKMFEEFRRGSLPDLAQAAAMGDPPKGEIVIVVGAPAPQASVTEADIEAGGADAHLRNALARLPVREAAQEVAAILDAPRRPLYQRALILKGEA